MQKSPSSLSKLGALDAKSRLKEMKAQSSGKLILGHLYINSMRNKFEALKFIIDNNIDIFSISICDIETLLVEINLRKGKWLLNGSCNPNKSQISHHLECLNSLLDEHSKKYENYVFIGDFNMNTSDSSMKEFCSLKGLKI